ncbi:hypothetical protein LCGC14_2978020 [marine sediment metagenome]|uniref:Uncharacterized protein n=1 Tax=marine sediment metagenome TaxID=412755 RepID=A0A0F8X7F5_9ZZZZ
MIKMGKKSEKEDKGNGGFIEGIEEFGEPFGFDEPLI